MRIDADPDAAGGAGAGERGDILTLQCGGRHARSYLSLMGNLKKKRRLKMNKHKRRKRLKSNRHKKRTWQK